MLRLIAARLKTTIPSILGVIVVTFLLTRVLPGDTAAYFAGPAATPQAIADIRSKLGLDQPLPVQFVSYVSALVKGDLVGIVRARRASQATMRNIKQNLFFAFVYNAAGIPIAAGVLYPAFGILLSPVIAAAAMALSSVSVIGNALRLRTAALDRQADSA